MKHFLSAILLLFCLSANAVSTVIPEMRFRRLDTRDGLSNSQINYLFQDSKGIIWIGTSYGLNRYDGYRFRTYYNDPNDTTTLRNNSAKTSNRCSKPSSYAATEPVCLFASFPAMPKLT